MKKTLNVMALLALFSAQALALEFRTQTTTVKPAEKKDLLGFWRQGNDIIEFTKDNKYRLFDTMAQVIVTLKYKITKKNHYNLTGKIGSTEYNDSPFLFYLDNRLRLNILKLPRGPRKNHVRLTAEQIKAVKKRMNAILNDDYDVPVNIEGLTKREINDVLRWAKMKLDDDWASRYRCKRVGDPHRISPLLVQEKSPVRRATKTVALTYKCDNRTDVTLNCQLFANPSGRPAGNCR